MIKEQDFITKLDNPFLKYIVYEENKQILGYLEFNHIYDRIEIINIFVNEKDRRKNIGSKLVEYVINYGKNNKCINITLEVSKDNIGAISLYEKKTFKQIAIREKYYKGIDGILMELIL